MVPRDRIELSTPAFSGHLEVKKIKWKINELQKQVPLVAPE